MRLFFLPIIGLISMLSPAMAGPLSCYFEATVGIGTASTKLTDGFGDSLNGLSSMGGLYGPGVGCDVHIDKVVIGALARYDFGHMTTSATLGSTSVSAELKDPWLLAARAGIEVNSATLLYGLIGYSGAQADLSAFGIPKTNLTGITYGAGVEWNLPHAWTMKVEYDFTPYNKFTAGSITLQPDVQQVRLGLTYHFLSGPSLFEDAKTSMK